MIPYITIVSPVWGRLQRMKNYETDCKRYTQLME